MRTTRGDRRPADQLRPVRIEAGRLAFAEGSASVELGETRVPATPAQSTILLAAFVDADVERYIRCPLTSAIMTVHTTTFPATPLREPAAAVASQEIKKLRSVSDRVRRLD